MYSTIAPFTPGPLPAGSAQLGITDGRPTWSELQATHRARVREARAVHERARDLRRHGWRAGPATWLLSLIGR